MVMFRLCDWVFIYLRLFFYLSLCHVANAFVFIQLSANSLSDTSSRLIILKTSEMFLNLFIARKIVK